MCTKVLVPVDGSDFSLQVLPFVTRLLNPATTELLLLHVAAEPMMVQLGESSNPDLTIYADQEAASMEAAFTSAMTPHLRNLTNAGFQASTIMRYGDPTAQIEALVADEGIDLVAMTTHGRTGLARMLLGSVAQHVLNHAQAPVLLYRSFAEDVD